MSDQQRIANLIAISEVPFIGIPDRKWAAREALLLLRGDTTKSSNGTNTEETP